MGWGLCAMARPELAHPANSLAVLGRTLEAFQLDRLQQLPAGSCKTSHFYRGITWRSVFTWLSFRFGGCEGGVWPAVAAVAKDSSTAVLLTWHRQHPCSKTCVSKAIRELLRIALKRRSLSPVPCKAP